MAARSGTRRNAEDLAKVLMTGLLRFDAALFRETVLKAGDAFFHGQTVLGRVH